MKKLFITMIAAMMIACGGEGDVNNKTTDNGTDQSTDTTIITKDAIWRGVIDLNDSIELPFNFWIENGDSNMVIINGEERIRAKMQTSGDSVRIQMPVFANYLKVKWEDGKMNGYYINPDAEDYRLKFEASANKSSRFPTGEKNCCDINEKWAAKFHPGTEKEKPAIGYFQQNGNKVHGTFMTETGDYRYLEGVLSGDQLRLSAFDGAHLVVFHARIKSGQKMSGHYFSGRSYSAPWIAYRDDDFELRDPEKLTWLKQGYNKVSFTFPDLDGDTVSLEDEPFKNKPVIVQIMGSWCPNCMDESRYLKDVYEAYADKGLEIVALTFERARDQETAIQRARKMKEDLDLPYPVLMAGYTRDDKPEEVLPELNRVMSFPTSIYLNSDHEVVNIHTGFSGPGTPVYDQYITENKILIEDLVLRDQDENRQKIN